MATINQFKAVQEQYKTADNLNTRISIHEKYSTNKTGFGNWLFSHYDFPDGSNVLEIGCGTGIMPFIAGLLKEYGVTDTTNKKFTLQNGYGILKKYFSDVQRLDYEDSLAVTNVDDLLDYIYSLTNMSSDAGIGRQTLKGILEKEMKDGILKVPKEYGMFICRK